MKILVACLLGILLGLSQAAAQTNCTPLGGGITYCDTPHGSTTFTDIPHSNHGVAVGESLNTYTRIPTIDGESQLYLPTPVEEPEPRGAVNPLLLDEPEVDGLDLPFKLSE